MSNPTVTIQYLTRSRTYTIRGTKEQVLEYVEVLKLNYPPQGYSTYVQKEGYLEDGNYEAVVWRSDSCD